MRKRKVAFALLAMGLSLLVGVVALLVGDLFVHRKFMDFGGVNVWGYRGPSVGRKAKGEQRVVVLGESTALGYGVRADQAFPAVLEGLLNQQVAQPAVSVVNLAFNGEGAYAYRFTLTDYDYLNYDAIVLYTGYGDLPYREDFQTANHKVGRRESALFRLTGYYPMLPLVLREKAMAIRYNGRLEDAYEKRPTVFRPNVAQRSAATALETAARLSEYLDGYAESGKSIEGRYPFVLHDSSAVECGKYTGYCGELYLTIKFALDRGKSVLVVTQPYVSALHHEQQASMVEYLHRRFAGASALHFASVGNAIDLHDPVLSLDGMHLTAAGNAAIAGALVSAVRETLAAKAPSD